MKAGTNVGLQAAEALAREGLTEELEFSRPAPPKIGSVPLRRLAEEALALLASELDHAGVVSRVEEAPGTPAAAADADQLFQAVINLLRNAAHAMPQGGEIVVRLRGVPYGVEMAIVDTGVGMSEDVLAHALEGFYTTKAKKTYEPFTIKTSSATGSKWSRQATPWTDWPSSTPSPMPTW